MSDSEYKKSIPWELSEMLEKVAAFLSAGPDVQTALIGHGSEVTAHRFSELHPGDEHFVRVCVWIPPTDFEDGTVRLVAPSIWISYQCSQPDSSDFEPERSMRAIQRAVYARLQGEQIALDTGQMLLPLKRIVPPTSPTFDPDYDVLTSREIWQSTLAPS